MFTYLGTVETQQNLNLSFNSSAVQVCLGCLVILLCSFTGTFASKDELIAHKTKLEIKWDTELIRLVSLQTWISKNLPYIKHTV